MKFSKLTKKDSKSKEDKEDTCPKCGSDDIDYDEEENIFKCKHCKKEWV